MSTWDFDCSNIHKSLARKHKSYVPDFINCAIAFDSFINKITPLNQGIHYTIYESHELLSDLTNLSQALQTKYQEIKNNFTCGIDNSDYCSKMHLQHAYKDNMFRHHGIYHFHFAKQQNGRTNELLFVKIQDKNIYMITIKDHKYFYDLEVFDIINNNWPHLLPKIPGIVTSARPDSTPDEIKMIADQNAIFQESRNPSKLKSLLDNDINPIFLMLNDGSCTLSHGGVNTLGFEISLTMAFLRRKKYIYTLNKKLNCLIKFNEYYQPINLAIFDIENYAIHLSNSNGQHCFIFSVSTAYISNDYLLKKFPVLNQLNNDSVIYINDMQKCVKSNPFKKGYSIVILNQFADHVQFI